MANYKPMSKGIRRMVTIVYPPEQKGFSLTELSVTLIIIGIILSTSLSLSITSDFHVKSLQTTTKLSQIEEALQSYVRIHKRLPCPADGTLPLDNTLFGIAGTASATGCTGSNFNDGIVYAGVLPTRTLQLPDGFMVDGWKRRFTYIVDSRFTNNAITNPQCAIQATASCLRNTPAGTISINDSNGSARTTEAIYVLISHGENGHGAYRQNGTSSRINAYRDINHPYRNNASAEMQNAHLDADGTTITPFISTFIDTNIIRQTDTTAPNHEYFDDILHFVTKEQLIYRTGALIYNLNCLYADEIANNPGNNACIGADNVSACETFATEILQRCLRE